MRDIIKIEIWSDVICPWCYIGKRRFESALAKLPDRNHFDIIWRSFELDPEAPQLIEGTLEQMLSNKYGVSRTEASAMNERVTSLAREEGLDYRLDIARPGNTFDAHRLLKLASSHQHGERATERLMRAYFCEGMPVGDREALTKLAPDLGITTGEALQLFDSSSFANTVRADELRARELGITGVPFFLINENIGISGAQPAEAFVAALQRI